jgi:CSLREA domain-containing protein
MNCMRRIVILVMATLTLGPAIGVRAAFEGSGAPQELQLLEPAACIAHTVHVVNTLADEDDGSLNGTGRSLRDAISEAEAGDVIVFDPSLADGTIVLSLGELTITISLTIDGDVDGDGGADITLDGDHTTSMITYEGLDTCLRLQHLDFQNAEGGVIYQGSGDLEVFRCAFVQNSSSGSGSAIFKQYSAQSSTRLFVYGCQFHSNTSAGGGAISVTASGPPDIYHTIIENSEFTYNDASQGGAISVNSGGARYPVLIANCRFSSNSANRGGAISVTSAAARIDNCSFILNGGNITYKGGAIYVFDATGAIDITDCLFSANYATRDLGEGGAVYAYNVSGSSDLNVSQTLFIDNIATWNGGAVYVLADSEANASFSHCTMMYNLLDVETGNDGWAISNNGGSVELYHTLVSFYHPTDPPYGQLIDGGFTSLGYNMFGAFTVPEAIGTDILGGDPDSGNGVPGPASDAIDAGDPTLVAGQNGTPFADLSSNSRISGNIIDIGAYETSSSPHPGPSVSSITRLGPPSTNEACVQFLVTFDEGVEYVTPDDFAATVSGTLIGAVVESIEAGSDGVYTVTVSTGDGTGTLRLDVRDDDSIVSSTTRVPLGGFGEGNGDYTDGESYTIGAGPAADLDNDGDVDLTDYDQFSQCFSGAGMPPAAGCPAGVDADLDDDGDVDMRDYSDLAAAFTGTM